MSPSPRLQLRPCSTLFRFISFMARFDDFKKCKNYHFSYVLHDLWGGMPKNGQIMRNSPMPPSPNSSYALAAHFFYFFLSCLGWMISKSPKTTTSVMFCTNLWGETPKKSISPPSWWRLCPKYWFLKFDFATVELPDPENPYKLVSWTMLNILFSQSRPAETGQKAPAIELASISELGGARAWYVSETQNFGNVCLKKDKRIYQN